MRATRLSHRRCHVRFDGDVGASFCGGTAVKHLDVDAPLLFKGLAEQEDSGLWNTKTVQCSTGSFASGAFARPDYLVVQPSSDLFACRTS